MLVLVTRNRIQENSLRLIVIWSPYHIFINVSMTSLTFARLLHIVSSFAYSINYNLTSHSQIIVVNGNIMVYLTYTPIIDSLHLTVKKVRESGSDGKLMAICRQSMRTWGENCNHNFLSSPKRSKNIHIKDTHKCSMTIKISMPKELLSRTMWKKNFLWTFLAALSCFYCGNCQVIFDCWKWAWFYWIEKFFFYHRSSFIFLYQERRLTRWIFF
jgi:hypothetical protein